MKRFWTRRRPALILLVAGIAAAVAVAVVVLLPRGEHGPGPSVAPTPPVTAPPPTVTVPRRNPPASPRWGFDGSGWPDVCHGLVTTPFPHPLTAVRDTRPCPPGTRRITASTQIALTAQAGADVDRLDVGWGSIEPLRPSDAAARRVPRFNWGPAMSRYRAMIRDGIHPIVLAYSTPPWARAPGWDRPGACPGGGCIYPPAERYIPQWRTFIRALMEHMPEMRALEVWNEPNYAHFFAPHPNPPLYSRLLRAADDAAREANFDRPIVTGGLSPVPPAARKIAPAAFLSRIYELAGKSAFDGIGAHPYPSGPQWTATMAARLDQLRSVSRQFHDGEKPLWITEIGLGATPSGAGRFNVPLKRQGPVLTRMYRATQGDDVRAFIIFTLHDTGIPDSRFGVYGVLTPALRPKPAYCYLAQHLGGTNACSG
jgi:hypothetical protein